MKKKTAPKRTTAKKTVKRTIPRQSARNQTVIFRRIVILSACLVLIIGVAATFNRGTASQAVAGASIARGLFEQATITIPHVEGATEYNIYYKQTGEQNYTNAVRNIPPYVNTYLISYLKKGVTYEYTIATVINGKEVSFTPIQTLTDLQSM